MTSSTRSNSSRLGRVFAWLFSPRILTRGVFAVACVVTLIAVYYTAENWRGKRAWQECRRELESRGATFDWASRIPAPVPDDQNIFKVPDMAQWFVKQHSEIGQSKDLAARMSVLMECLRRRDLLATVSVPAAGASRSAGDAEVVLNRQAPPGPEFASAEAARLGELLRERLSGLGGQGPSFQGAQGLEFRAGAPKRSNPVRVEVKSDPMPRVADVSALFQQAATAAGVDSGSGFKVESAGTRAFEVWRRVPSEVDPAQYLACSDELAPVLDQVRTALERPYGRPEGGYSRPWAVPIPNFVSVRQVAQLLSQRALCHLMLEQPEKALEDLTLLHGLRRLVEGKPVNLVAAMIDVAVSGLYASTVADGLRLHAWREPQLAVLQQQLQAVRLVPALLGAIDTERVASCNLFETTPASELGAIFALSGKGFWSKVTSPEYLLARWMPRGWMYQNMKSIAWQDQWFLESVQTNDIVKPRVVEENGRKSLASLERRSPYNVLARVAMPNFLKAFQNTARNQALINEAYLACALERYRLANNQYPDRLEALIPGFAPALPVDPIGGTSLQYRRQQPDRFLLYSIGWDAADDGGNPADKSGQGDWVWDEPRS